ncbi:MAG: hypothetical protein OXB88_05405, partial [Bacteriovoracales bacterium]|nr:hypothetical protein [Bacteriovoracales bacterium]
PLDSTDALLNAHIHHVGVNFFFGIFPLTKDDIEEVGLLGADPADMVSGLWPSDHAGVFARLRLP